MLGLGLPERCLHCSDATARSSDSAAADALGRYLCSVCLRIFRSGDAPSSSALLARFTRMVPDVELEGVHSLRPFDPELPIRALIHSAKYDGMMRLAELLGNELALSIDRGLFDVMIPVPLHRTRLAERGYNQAEQIARGIDSQRVLTDVVRRVKPTKTQTRLHLEERRENVRGAFALTRRAPMLRGTRVLIVDDVMTTGATVMSVAEALIGASPMSITIATLAAARDADDLLLPI